MTEKQDRDQYLERALTPLEIDERKTIHLKLASEREENLAEIAGKRSEIRALNVSRKKLDLSAAQILREVRSGKVLELVPSRQPELPYDKPDPYAMFLANYPKPTSHAELLSQLKAALTDAEWGLMDRDVVLGWKRKSDIFDAVAHWVRVENAHKAHATRQPTPGLTLPARFELPGPLQQALASSQPKAARKAGKKAARRGARSKA